MQAQNQCFQFACAVGLDMSREECRCLQICATWATPRIKWRTSFLVSKGGFPRPPQPSNINAAPGFLVVNVRYMAPTTMMMVRTHRGPHRPKSGRCRLSCAQGDAAGRMCRHRRESPCRIACVTRVAPYPHRSDLMHRTGFAHRAHHHHLSG
eukprot:2475248-Pleurochrysis_carterae.AAC.1